MALTRELPFAVAARRIGCTEAELIEWAVDGRFHHRLSALGWSMPEREVVRLQRLRVEHEAKTADK